MNEVGPPGTPRLVTWCPAEGQGLVTAFPSLDTMPVQLGMQSALRLCDSAWATYFWVSLCLEQQEGLDLPPHPNCLWSVPMGQVQPGLHLEGHGEGSGSLRTGWTSTLLHPETSTLVAPTGDQSLGSPRSPRDPKPSGVCWCRAADLGTLIKSSFICGWRRRRNGQDR